MIDAIRFVLALLMSTTYIFIVGTITLFMVDTQASKNMKSAAFLLLMVIIAVQAFLWMGWGL